VNFVWVRVCSCVAIEWADARGFQFLWNTCTSTRIRCIYVYITCTYVYIHIDIYIYIYMSKWMLCVFACSTWTRWSPMFSILWNLCTCVHIRYICAYIYIYIYIYVYLYIYLYKRILCVFVFSKLNSLKPIVFYGIYLFDNLQDLLCIQYVHINKYCMYVYTAIVLFLLSKYDYIL